MIITGYRHQYTFLIKSLIVLLSVFFLSGFSKSIRAQSSEIKNTPKQIDKNKLVIHQNFRDDHPQHFNNYRSHIIIHTENRHLNQIKKISGRKPAQIHKDVKPAKKQLNPLHKTDRVRLSPHHALRKTGNK